MKDRTSQIESNVAGLRGGPAGLKAQLSDWAKVMKEMTNLEQEIAKLKEEMRELRVLNASMADQRLRDRQEIRDMKNEVELLRTARDHQQKS
jgi:predicted  nucleic acid-binding Zn-ribbon protein